MSIKKRLQNVARNTVRRAVGARDGEPIRDARRRNQIERIKKKDHVKYGKADLLDALKEIGVNPGDTLVVHSAWRAFYNFTGRPEDVISALQESVGECGNLLMPCYGAEKGYLDVSRTKSHVGVLSEIFRCQDGVRRAAVPHFTLAGRGPDIDELFAMETQCMYGFDDCAPYTKAIDKGAKVLLMGLPSNTSKISVFHRTGWLAKDYSERYASIWSDPIDAIIVDENGETHMRKMLPKRSGVGNHNPAFRKAFAAVPKASRSFGEMEVVLFDAQEAVDASLSMVREGLILYKGI